MRVGTGEAKRVRSAGLVRASSRRLRKIAISFPPQTRLRTVRMPEFYRMRCGARMILAPH
jgi:hypothetical protein